MGRQWTKHREPQCLQREQETGALAGLAKVPSTADTGTRYTTEHVSCNGKDKVAAAAGRKHVAGAVPLQQVSAAVMSRHKDTALRGDLPEQQHTSRQSKAMKHSVNSTVKSPLNPVLKLAATRPPFPLQWGLLVLCSVTVCGGIRVSRVVAPPWLESGGSALLQCEWQLQGDTLYSVKWYQGLREIYRYTPSKREPLMVFPNEHLVVDGSHSRLGEVQLRNVSLRASGLFRCEVSGDAPAFYTNYGAVHLRVIALPKGDPVIHGVRPQYKVGDLVNLTCVSPRAFPPPHLTFLINGEQAELLYLEPQRTYLTDTETDTYADTAPETSGSQQQQLLHSTLRLRFPLLQPLLTEGGTARVRCHARVEDIYEAADERLIRTRDARYQASVFGRFSGAAALRAGRTLHVLVLSIAVFSAVTMGGVGTI